MLAIVTRRNICNENRRRSSPSLWPVWLKMGSTETVSKWFKNHRLNASRIGNRCSSVDGNFRADWLRKQDLPGPATFRRTLRASSGGDHHRVAWAKLLRSVESKLAGDKKLTISTNIYSM